jgi:hypothetical protein
MTAAAAVSIKVNHTITMTTVALVIIQVAQWQ